MQNKEWKFYNNEFNTGYDIEIVRETPEGYELWGQNVSTHPWKERSYPPQFIRKIYRYELDAALRKQEEERKRYREEREEEERKEKAYREWLKEMAKEFPINVTFGMIEDEYGNLLFPIPRSLTGADKETFRRWLEEEYKKGYWYWEE